MGVKIFSNNMDEPDLKNAMKTTDIDPIKDILQKISMKAEKYKNQQSIDIESEDDFAMTTLEKVHIFYVFVLIQTILAVILGVYQIFSFKSAIYSSY